MNDRQDAPASPGTVGGDSNRALTLHWGAHVLFWAGYFAFRTAAANAAASEMPAPAEYQDFPFLLNRAVVVLVHAAASGALLAAALGMDAPRWAKLRPMILLVGCVVLLPVMEVVEEWIPRWLHPASQDDAFGGLVTYAFQFGWAMMLWGALQALIAYHNRVLEQTHAIARERSLAYDAQLKMLHYQINPHFLFNTLNAISTLVLDRRAEQAERMLMRLSGFLRYSLDRNPNQATPLAGEIEAQRKYLDIEQTRFGDKLDVTFDIAPGLERALMPSLLLQPILENAIKYAISPREEGGRIEIRVLKDGDLLRIWVDDDGPGMSASRVAPRRGLGLANARERLHLIHGDRAGLIAQNRPAGGFSVQIWLPYEEEKHIERAVARSVGG